MDPPVTETPNGLLDPHELAVAAPPEAIALPVDLIDPNPRNPRGKLVEIDALAENIKRFGLLQPITVRRQGRAVRDPGRASALRGVRETTRGRAARAAVAHHPRGRTHV
jgi:hypothetical protein